MTNAPLHRDNHYVPCLYLKQWAVSCGRVWTYRLLVSHPKVPLWKLCSPRGVASHTHLYTQVVSGKETDEFERWLDSEFESPVEEALRKATSGARLTLEDWKRLIRFLAAQDVRTPAWFAEQAKRWHATIPNLIDVTLRDSVLILEDAALTGQPPPKLKPAPDNNFPLRVASKRGMGQEMGQIEAEILVGRGLWLWGIKRALKHTLNALYQHRWTILLPPKGLTWFTTDNPVVRLNFNNMNDYNFGGGWGSPGTEIFLPLSPQHLMYTQIGNRPPRRGERMQPAQADIVRRMIAEHAYRLIFATEQDVEIHKFRPRVENGDLFRREQEQWRAWHEQQIAAEQELREPRINKLKWSPKFGHELLVFEYRRRLRRLPLRSELRGRQIP
jgi:hypothetical protein